MSSRTTFQQYLQSAFLSGSLSTDEVIEFVLPLFEEVLGFHQGNMVAPFENGDTIFISEGRLDIDEDFAHPSKSNITEVQKLQDQEGVKGYTITERILLDDDITQSKTEITNLHIQLNKDFELNHPVYLRGYGSFEILVGHHDAQTDIFCLGLVLGSAVMGLDLFDPEDLNKFVSYRNQPAGLNSRMHPTLCALVTEMTELDRGKRSADLQEIIQRLKFYRDYDPQRQTDLSKIAGLLEKKPVDRKNFILSKLKSRLFDTSRRNRLLYYKPNTKFVNLTVSSVPMVLHYQSINPQLLFTWNEEISKLIIRQNDLSLNKYLRFEDHPYLNAQLNYIRHQSDNDKKEYGFSQLKLVVAFLHWHNLKDAIHERIQSPLLLLPVELERKKSLKEERFVIRIIDNAATVNPVLAHQLKELYGISLPESIDFDDTSMEQFFQLVQSQIDAAKQGVKLNYIDKPRIKIVHSIARQTINNYRKRLKQKGIPVFHQVDYSYSEENYKPLGLELYRHKVEPKQSTLEFLLSDGLLAPTSSNFATVAEGKVKSSFQLTDGENNPYSWDFDVCNTVLGNFNYKKMSLVSDYTKASEINLEHPVFNALFSAEPNKALAEEVINNPAEWYHVITADPTQAKAVLFSRSGNSYIIQGPPGTGKSQTITNLIADFLAKGKSVLFICEKRAALDVVYHRLQQNKLAELCCYIHDSQGDKKEFYKDLKTVYEDFVKNKMDLDSISLQRKMVLERFMENIATLSLYHTQLQRESKEAGITTRSLIESVVRLKAHIPELKDETLPIPDYYQWLQFGSAITQLATNLEETGADLQLANHPFSNLGIPLLRSENPFLLMDSLVEHSYKSLEHLREIIDQHNIPHEHTVGLENIKNLIEDSVLMVSLAQSGNLQLVDAANEEAKAFEEAYRIYRELQEDYTKIIEKNSRWNNKFDKEETEQALPLALQHEKKFFSFFNGSWRKLKKQLSQSYDFSGHNIKPTFTQVLQQLQEEYHEGEKLKQKKADIQNRYRVEGLEAVYLGIELLRSKRGDREIDFLLAHPGSNELVLKLSKLNNSLHSLELALKQCLHGFSEKSLAQIKDELATIASNKAALKNLLPSLRRFSELPESLQSLIRKVPLTPIQAEALMANKTLTALYDNNRSFHAINHKRLQETAAEIQSCYDQLLHLNSDLIRARRRQQFLSHYEMSNASQNMLPPEMRQIKKDYTEGRKVLEHEMNKTMRYKSIREIASHQSGKILKDIKPVWLMSPLSVSDSLPLETNYFDVVIFDEASQITLEEGIPALFRAPQSIIVGDDKQMPPSNFFNSRSEDPDDLEVIEGESEDEILSVDADSLLVQGARKLSSTMLCWHYRSRYETLISYSNHAFYDAGLLTIPDKSIHSNIKPLLEIGQPEEGAKTALRLLEDSISFHLMTHGVYEGRSNLSEAKYIAQMVRALLLKNVQETIGIVAFSQEQQSVIEEAIDQMALEDKVFEEVLEKAYNRKDEGQFTGLFIKNLENVQGDERDIIIMSICYGPDANKKMLMNFGPINRKGGEKRLNVIFSRAKKHMAVISTIRHHQITNDYNEGANYLKRFLKYTEMVSTGNMSGARTILDGLVPTKTKHVSLKTDFSHAVLELKTALEKKGYVVDEEIGQSNFKCSLAVKKKAHDDEYLLGILLDNEAHYRNNDLVEQYVQRPALLQAFGWEMIQVFTKDWLDDPDRIIQSIILKLERNKLSETQSESFIPKESDIVLTEEVETNFTELQNQKDMKFWRVERLALQLHIQFGKIGTMGQVQVKSFGSEEELRSAEDALIQEKISQGFEVINKVL